MSGRGWHRHCHHADSGATEGWCLSSGADRAKGSYFQYKVTSLWGRRGDVDVGGATMSASQFVQYLTQALYLLISLVVIHAAARRPTRARMDIAIFFGVITLIFAESWALKALGVRAGPGLAAVSQVLLMALPYLLIRLVSDFAVVPPLIMRGGELGLVLSI